VSLGCMNWEPSTLVGRRSATAWRVMWEAVWKKSGQFSDVGAAADTGDDLAQLGSAGVVLVVDKRTNVSAPQERWMTPSLSLDDSGNTFHWQAQLLVESALAIQAIHVVSTHG